jgi:hypothetical protein
VFKADHDWGAVQMSTITITNPGDTPVAGETDLRQAVAEAHSGDTIVLASGDFGELIQLKSPLVIPTGANLTIDFGAGQDNGIDGSIIVNAGATATIANMFITDDELIGADSPDVPKDGEGGVAGVPGAEGGGAGTNGSGGGNGSVSMDPGADALGAVQNHGALTLVNDSIVGDSVAGNGAKGGDGGDGARGGDGGDNDDGDGGSGGNGGSGGPGGAASAGGNAVGGILTPWAPSSRSKTR